MGILRSESLVCETTTEYGNPLHQQDYKWRGVFRRDALGLLEQSVRREGA